MNPLPVTVVSGFQGVGKTALLQHVLDNCQGKNVAVLVNDSTVDRTRICVRPSETPQIALGQGCICCTLRESLIVEVGRLALEQKYDYLLIESAAIAEPLQVVESFTFKDDQGTSLSRYARLDALVTVVDARTFFEEYVKADYLTQRGLALDPKDDRTVVDVLIDQVEFANVIVLNKTDLVPAEYVEIVAALLRKLNPVAEIIPATHGQVPLEKILNTGQFDARKIDQSAGWIHAAQNDDPTPDRHGISSFVYRARRPFCPERLLKVLESPHEGLLRVKGLFWLCTRMAVAGLLDLAGGACRLESAGYWLAALPDEEARADAEQWQAAQAIWDENWGDRRQELVFIGIKFDHAAVKKALDGALLTDQEMKQSPAVWAVMEDPFGEWDTPDEETDEDEE